MSASASHEVEAKFVIETPAQAEYLQSTPTLTSAFVLGATTTVEHVDTYVDTPAYTLLRAGYALRIRHTPDGYRITIKGLLLTEDTHLHKRIELEEPLAEAADPLDIDQWPHSIRKFLGNQLDAARDLQPLFTLHQVRHKRLVTTAAGRNNPPPTPFAELSVDEVQVYLPQQAAYVVPASAELAQQSAIMTFQEVEAELLPDQDETALETLGHKLARVRGLRASDQSKFARALEAANGRLCIDQGYAEYMQPTMHMADACRLIWRQQLTQLLLNEVGVRYSSDSEYVHDMRVAVRRVRTAMRLFGRYFHRKSIRRFRRTLKATGRRLGAVRDQDVALDKLATFEQDERAGAQTDFSPVATAWQSQRDEAFAELVAWFDSDKYTRFVAEFARFCATPGKGAREFFCAAGEVPEPHQVRHVIPSMLMKQFERVRTFELLFEAGTPIPAKTLHQLRIQCKFLRYNLEFAQHLLGPSGAHLIGSLKQVQQHLGDLNDAAVSQRMLTSVPFHDRSQAVDEYYAAQAAAIEQLRNQVRERLQEFVGLANRRRLAQAIARI